MSVDAVHASETLVLATAVDFTFVGTEGGVVSLEADVVTFKLADCAELFPAESYALTVYVYDVEGANPVSL